MTDQQVRELMAGFNKALETCWNKGQKAINACSIHLKKTEQHYKLRLRTCEVVRSKNIDMMKQKIAILKRQRDQARRGKKANPLYVTIAAVVGAGVSAGICGLASRR